MQRCGLRVREMMAAAVLVGSAGPAWAQNAAPVTPASRTLADVAASQAVDIRARPEYDAAGIPAGGFRLYPTLQLQGAYDDNIFNTSGTTGSDGFVRVSPRIVARSGWSRHSLIISTGAQLERYFTRGTESNDQYDVAADGRLDVSSSVAINGGGGYARRVEPRGTLGDIFATGDRIRYDLGTARLSTTGAFGHLLITGGGTFSSFNYLPVQINGVTVSQDYRGRDEKTGLLRADYVVGPGIRTFISGSYNNQSYRRALAGFNQDSHGYAVLGGLVFGLSELLSGEVGVGYLDQHYAQAGLASIGGFSYNARIIWNPTPLLTVTGSAARTIQQSPFVTRSGILQDSVGVNADYEVLRNLIVSGTAQFASEDYRGLGRLDQLWVLEARGRYLVNRWMEAGLTVNHRFQTTANALGRHYAGSSVLLGVTLKR